MEAGGHIGPVSTGVLAQEILPNLPEVPVFVAGGIGRGEAIVSYLEMGAAGVQLGTRFVCATESIAHPRFKQAFIRAAARDAVASVQLDPRFPVIPVRALVNPATERFLAVHRGDLVWERACLGAALALAVMVAGMQEAELDAPLLGSPQSQCHPSEIEAWGSRKTCSGRENGRDDQSRGAR